MGAIEVLPAALASQIAAGEVVERPANALKELLENSLDAGANRCDVEIEGGGITLLRLSDDGCGMAPDDAALCVQRHATSKLKRFEQLQELSSFGFRGEALPTLSSVSRFVLRTRSREHDTGTEVRIEGGQPPEVRPAGMAVGTLVEMRDLFYNVPARRKFLRSSGTESGHIAEVVDAAALATPNVTFTLMRDGRRAREWLRVQTRSERVAQVLPDEPLAPCVGERGPLSVEAYLGRPERARAGANALRFFCNGRPIRDRALLHAVARAYGSVLERGRYPRGVVYLDLPSRLVDVNVHPQKAEVRFADAHAVCDALYHIVSRQLSHAFGTASLSAARQQPQPAAPQEPPAPPQVEGAPAGAAAPVAPSDGVSAAFDPRLSETALEEPSSRAPSSGQAEARGVSWGASDHRRVPRLPYLPLGGSRSSGERGSPPPSSAQQLPLDAEHSPGVQRLPVDAGLAPTGIGESRPASDALLPKREQSPGDIAWKGLRLVGQARACYWICEGDTGLYVLDQHAAAERVTFHRLRQQYLAKTVASQALLFPTTLRLEPRETESLEQHLPTIERLGFELRLHSETTVSVHRVPQLLASASPERLVRDLLDELSANGREFSEAVDTVLATMACHGSVRAGERMSREEAQALLLALDEVDFSGHCPHGRPVVMFTPWAELERRVGRR